MRWALVHQSPQRWLEMKFLPGEFRVGLGARLKNGREDALVNGDPKLTDNWITHRVHAGVTFPFFSRGAKLGARFLLLRHRWSQGLEEQLVPGREKNRA